LHLLLNFDEVDASRRRALPAALEHLGNVLGPPRKHRFHPAIAPIANPAVETEVAGNLFRPIAKADALHVAFETDPYAAPILNLLRHGKKHPLIAQGHPVLAGIGSADQHAVGTIDSDHLRPAPRQLAPQDLVA